MTVNSHRANMNHFKAPTFENDLGRLSEKQIHDMDIFTQRANQAYDWFKRNGIQEHQREAYEIYKEVFRINKADDIDYESIYAIDSAISQTVWDADTFSKIGIPTQTMVKPRWQLKDYLVTSKEYPAFTKNFSEPAFIHLDKSQAWSNGIGLHQGLIIPFTEIRESSGALWSPESIMMQELAAKMGIQKSRRGFLGTSCQDARADDGSDASGYGITGLFNYASNQTFEAGAGGDDDVTAAGDIEYTIRVALTDLKKVYQPGKFVIVSTSGIASEMFIHRDTYQQRLDSERVKEILSIITGFQRAGQWGGWWVTENLYASAPAAANQQMMVMKVGPGLMNRHLVYPTQMMPMMSKEYSADIKENMIFGDIIQVKNVDTTNNAVPITIAADVTATTTGFIPEGTRIL